MYKIPYRRALGLAAARASKGILHTNVLKAFQIINRITHTQEGHRLVAVYFCKLCGTAIIFLHALIDDYPFMRKCCCHFLYKQSVKESVR